MKGVLGSGGAMNKRVGFKLLPADNDAGADAVAERDEKKSDDSVTLMSEPAHQDPSSGPASTSSSMDTVASPPPPPPTPPQQQSRNSTLVLETSTANQGTSSCLKQSSTPSTCSPASSAASTPTNVHTNLHNHNHKKVLKENNNNSNSNNNKKSPSTFRKKFRLPRYFRIRRRNSSNASLGNSQGEHSEDEELAQAAANTDDPVMAVFQSRYKNRVRWSLEEDEPATTQKHQKHNKITARASANGESTLFDNHKKVTIYDSTTGGALDTSLSGPTGSSTPRSGNNSSINIKKFVKGALFGGGGGGNKKSYDEEFQKEVAKEVEREKDLVWESNHDSPDGGEILYTSSQRIQSFSSSNKQSQQQGEPQIAISFTEDPKTRAAIMKLIKKGRRAQSVYYRYDYAVKYFVRALDMLTEAKYPDLHPTVRKTLESLNEAHHKLSSFNNSANIVKIGIKYEDSGELVRALKMYSIAYRIRRDNLSRTHPSLVVLLNMLGSIQAKRGEYEEAMQIYELALKDPPKDPALLESSETPATTPTANAANHGEDNQDHQQQLNSSSTSLPPPPPPQTEHEQFSIKGNLLAKSVTYREMGTIFEKWDRRVEALKMYHLSLDCVAEWKAAAGVSSAEKGLRLIQLNKSKKGEYRGQDSPASTLPSGEANMIVDKVRVKKSYASFDRSNNDEGDEQAMEKGEMEMLVGLDIPDVENSDVNAFSGSISYYDSFFPPHLDAINAQKGRSTAMAAAMASGDTEGLDRRDDYADIDVALTIHQIAQLFRKQGEFNKALEAYAVALRGMKYSLGNYHPNVAAILGNFGNLQKEMGDLNAAYDTYQEVLGIESYRLGLSHPDVAITLHNIATIDAARGNHQRALKLYEQVMCLQEKLFGREHISIAVTSACMGDVYEALGQMKDAFESYEDSLRIKSGCQGHHSLDVARILHKLAKVALKRGDHRLASSYASRALFVYRLNKVPDNHEWVIDAHRDSADIDASLALTKKMTFEC